MPLTAFQRKLLAELAQLCTGHRVLRWAAASASVASVALGGMLSLPTSKYKRGEAFAHQAAGPIALVKSFWKVGVLDNNPEQEFGNIVDAALDADGNAYLLDGPAQTVRVFDREGKFIRTVGRSGVGPGEFSTPRAIFHDRRDTLYVLDQRNGLALFFAAHGEVRYVRTVRPAFNATDVCLLGNKFFFYGTSGNNVVHEASRDGQLLKSFGDLFGKPTGHPVQGALSYRGKIACIAESGTLVTVAAPVGEVRGYRSSDGTLLWTDSLPGFVQMGVVLMPGAYYSWTQPATGVSSNVVLLPLDEAVVLSQSRLVARGSDLEAIHSCFLIVRTGKCVGATQQLPRINAVVGRRALGIAQTSYSTATLFEVAYERRKVDGLTRQ